VTPLGNIPFSLWILVFLCGHLLWFYFSPVLSISESSGYPDRPSGSRGLFKFCVIFQNFDYVQTFSHCNSLQPARIGRVHIFPLGSVRGSRTLLKGHLRESLILTPCSIASLRTHFFKNLDLSFGIFNCPDQSMCLIRVSWTIY
jgi:hypothetical protein